MSTITVHHNISGTQAASIAKAHGAVRVRDYRVKEDSTAFSRHYFNAVGLEVAYYVVGMHSLGVFEKPRAWGDSALSTLEEGRSLD